MLICFNVLHLSTCCRFEGSNPSVEYVCVSTRRLSGSREREVEGQEKEKNGENVQRIIICDHSGPLVSVLP